MNLDNSNEKLNETNELSEEEYSTDESSVNSDSSDEEESESVHNIELEKESLPGTVIKKKRGRKPKEKTKEELIEKTPKKRGRKPKEKDENEIEKIKKKRGRKPKEKVYSVKELPKTFFEENKNEPFILHLPIKKEDKNNDNNPLPDLNKGINYSSYNEVINTYNISEDNLLPTQFNLLDDKNNKFNLNFDFNDYDDNIISHNNNIQKNEVNNNFNHSIISEKYDTSIKKEDDKVNKVIKKNLKNILYEFINANNEKTWPESTNTYCWWCCHPFTNTPCSLPEYYKKEKFYVSGCFCSFNCTASYNFSKNDDDIWERFSLLNLMYKKLYNHKFVKINLAPPRETLKIFGGYLSIEEFREAALKNDKSFLVVKPPLISIIPKIEENILNNIKNLKNSFPQTNENILNKTQNSLKLKRSKPVTNPNSTLQSFMDLKIV
jgi:hypothetical protein